MRVLQINAVYGVGSTGVIVKDIHELALKNGIESYVVYSSSIINPDDIINGYKMGTRIGKKAHALFSRIFGLQGYYSSYSTRKLFEYLDTVKPDVIHLHNLHSNFINIPMLFKYIGQRKIKTLITLHDCWFFTGKCSHFLYDGCDKWLNNCGKCPRLNKDIPSFFWDRTKKMLANKKRLIGDNPYVYVVGCSNWITKVAKKSILKERVIGTVYNGVNLSVFYPHNSDLREIHGLKNKFVVLGFAGKWLSDYNRSTYEAFCDCLDENTKLLLLGCTAEQVSTLNENVIGVPFISNKDLLAQYYSIADVFVNVTKADTLPTVNIEAMACGTPVITYASGGSPEILSETTGRVFEFGDYNSLIDCVKRIKEKKIVFDNDECVQRVAKNFEKEACFFEYINLYKDLKGE